MTVTSIREYQKRKVLVCLDGHLEFPMYKSEADKYHLREQEELSDDIYLEIMKLLAKRVKIRAMSLLEKRSYTREKLRQKLLESRYPVHLIEEALEYVASYKYLDDFKYAEEYIRCYCETRSKRRIQQELYMKGVNHEIVQQAWAKHEIWNTSINETVQIMELLRKKNYHKETADYKETARMMNYLLRKGYCIEDIRKCIQMPEEYC